MDNIILNKFKNPNTNWKHIAIVAILAFLVGGGILAYQYWWWPKQEVPIEFPEIKQEEEEAKKEEKKEFPIKCSEFNQEEKGEATEGEFVEVSIEELKKGENRIGDIKIEKIIPLKLDPIKASRTTTEDKDIDIAEYEIGINNLTIEDVRESGGLRDYIIYYNNKEVGKSSIIPTAPSPDILSFSYWNKKYIIVSSEASGSGGIWNVYDFYVVDDNNLKPVVSSEEYPFFFRENLGYLIIGYENFLNIVSVSSGQAGFGHPWEYLTIYIMDTDKGITKKEKSFRAACSGYGPYGCFISPRALSLIEKNKKLYTKISDSYHCSFWDRRNERCIKYDICPALFYIGMAEYYLLTNGELLRAGQEFKENYLRLVARYEELLQKEEWGKLCKQRGEWCRSSNDWLSPLLGRTLSYIFAGEEGRAWEEFDKDFIEFSKKYPLEVDGEVLKIDPQKIKQEIQKDF